MRWTRIIRKKVEYGNECACNCSRLNCCSVHRNNPVGIVVHKFFFLKNYAWFNMELRNGIRTLLVVRFHNQYFWLQHFHEHWLMVLYASNFFFCFQLLMLPVGTNAETSFVFIIHDLHCICIGM